MKRLKGTLRSLSLRKITITLNGSVVSEGVGITMMQERPAIAVSTESTSTFTGNLLSHLTSFGVLKR